MNAFARFFPADLHPALAVAGQLIWLLQIGLVIHVYRTGRPYWWTWVLFAAPVVGGLAYVFIELSPDLRGPRGFWYSIKPRRWRIADCRAHLDESETVENRLTLAEELADAGEDAEAHEVAQACLCGVFKDDPHTLAEVAAYKLAVHDFEGAEELLDRVDTTRDRMLETRVDLLRADTLAGLGRDAEAETLYRGLLTRYSGEAAQAGLAAVYERTERWEEAAHQWREIRTRYRRANRAWRRSERRWYRLATERLKVLARKEGRTGMAAEAARSR